MSELVKRFDVSRELDRALEKVYIEAIMGEVGVDNFVAHYALSTRIYEIVGLGFSNHMIGVTRDTVGQWKQGEQEKFREALFLARELLPGDPDNEIRF